MILEPGDQDHEVLVAETFHEQTDEELTKKEVKQMEADDQAIHTILVGLPEDIYAVVDSCETNVGNQNGLIVVLGIANPNANKTGNDNVVAALAQGNTNGNNADLDEIEEVNANCILMANLQQASTSGTQTDNAPVYDTDGSAKVHENYDDNEIFNMFTQEEQYTELLEPIPESYQVPQNDIDVISEDTSVEQGGETVEQHPTNFEETHMTTELARNKNQERVKKNMTSA
nr:hypothetical protein [Tanacetum cinerariifolium]